MTNEEALKLKPGDRIEAKSCTGKWIPVTVDEEFRSDGWGRTVWVTVRKDKRDSRGRVIRLSRTPSGIRPAPNLDPLPANIYSDWLEENGFPEAASALRAAFPLPPVEEGRRDG